MAKPHRLIAIDPGAHAVGWASFESGELRKCGMADRERVLDGLFSRVPSVNAVIEQPQIYEQRAQKGDPNDLISVALTAGFVECALVFGGASEVQYVWPRKWKGGVKKNLHNARVLAQLEADELQALKQCGVFASKRHNVIDAIGIGLWRLGRLK